MTTATKTANLADALAEVLKWEADEQTRQNAELVEVDQEVQSLQTAVANLQQQLEALSKFRGELVAKSEALPDEIVQRSYQAIFAALTAQAELVAQRTAQVNVAEQAKAAAVEAAMGSGEIAALLDEYKQFKTAVEPTLAALPESYRSVMMKHHNDLAEQLKAHVQTAMEGPIDLDVDDLPVEVAFAVDAPEGKPELLIIVIPVSEEVTAEWSTRPQDLQTMICARVMQALYETVKGSGPAGVEAVTGGHRGMLAVEVDLLGAADDFAQKLIAAIAEVDKNATELNAAGVSLEARQVVIDYLLPPEDHTEGE